MRIIFKPSRFEIRRTKIKYIVIHHTLCQYSAPQSKIDNAKFQIPSLIGNVLEKKQADLNYNFIIEKIKNDYFTIMCRPFIYLCEYPDIDSKINKACLHVALMGSYDFKIPEDRLYQSLAYHLLSPLIKHFKINPNLIYLHRDISNKDLTCPGSFIDKDKIITMIRRFVVK